MLAAERKVDNLPSRAYAVSQARCAAAASPRLLAVWPSATSAAASAAVPTAKRDELTGTRCGARGNGDCYPLSAMAGFERTAAAARRQSADQHAAAAGAAAARSGAGPSAAVLAPRAGRTARGRHVGIERFACGTPCCACCDKSMQEYSKQQEDDYSALIRGTSHFLSSREKKHRHRSCTLPIVVTPTLRAKTSKTTMLLASRP